MKLRSVLRNKKGAGAFGFDEASSALIALMILVVVGVLTVIILNSLGQTSVISSSTYASNVINNTTSGLSTFFGNVGTWLTLLSVTIIVLIVVTVIVVLRRGGEHATSA